MRAPLPSLLFLVTLLAPASALETSTITLERRSVSLYVPAVAEEPDGRLVGVLSVLTLTLQEPGRGDVFVRTDPLAEVDMQGAARLAVAAAAEVTGRSVRRVDFFYTMTTGSPVIGGPSAGGAMAVAATAALMGWDLDPRAGMTGMINPDLSIGPVGGILQKAEAMASVNVRTFLVPAGQTTQTVQVEERREDGTVVVRRETIDVAAHARREWGMTVQAVDDLYSVIPVFTGQRVEPPSTQSDPTQREEYQSLMRDLSGRQLEDAATSLETAKEDFQRLQESMGAGDRASVRDALAAAETALERAGSTSEQHRYYQASSFGFQSLVQSRYAQALLEFRDAGSSVDEYVTSYVATARAELERARSEAANPYPWTASELGSQAALELRLSEADLLLDATEAKRQAGQYAAALQDASYARERIRSAAWWALLRDRLADVGPPANVTREALRSLYVEYDATATLTLTYAQRILQEGGAQAPARLAGAAATLAQAQAMAREERYAGALFGTLHALSQVNAAIAGLGGNDLRQRLDVLRERAAFEIERARALDIEPVFAVSLFEFAESQRADDPAEALEGLTWARMAARATLVAAGAAPSPANWSPVRSPMGPGLAERVLVGAAWTWTALVAVPLVVSAGLAVVLTSRTDGKK